MHGSLAGRLLASRPDLHDPNFDGTITLLLEHDSQGAFGVILNRPSAVSVDELVPRWSDVVTAPRVMFAGGPVQTDAVLALAFARQPLADDSRSSDEGPIVDEGPPVDDELPAESAASGPPGNDVGEVVLPLGLQPVDLDADPALAVAKGLEHVRLFAGYAGWGAGQLEGELAMEAWWVLDATVDDVFSPQPETLWARVLRREGGDLQWFAHLPADPSLN